MWAWMAMGTAHWWGPATTTTNPLGELIENLIMELDLEIVNHPDCPPHVCF